MCGNSVKYHIVILLSYINTILYMHTPYNIRIYPRIQIYVYCDIILWLYLIRHRLISGRRRRECAAGPSIFRHFPFRRIINNAWHILQTSRETDHSGGQQVFSLYINISNDVYIHKQEFIYCNSAFSLKSELDRNSFLIWHYLF